MSLYNCTPEPRLDQSQTVNAIAALQVYIDLYPDGNQKKDAQQRLFELQDKLVQKELYSAQLYYDLGQYFGNCTYGGNNYEACIITAQNALKDYPYSSLREKFSVLVMKSKFELAQQSVEEKKLERFQVPRMSATDSLTNIPTLRIRQWLRSSSASVRHTRRTNI